MKVKDLPKAETDNAKLLRIMTKISLRRKEEVEKLRRENEKLKAEIERLKTLLGEKE